MLINFYFRLRLRTLDLGLRHLWLRHDTLLYKSQALLYEVLGAPTNSFSFLSFFSSLCGSAYTTVFLLYLFFFLALQSFISLMVVFLLILRLPEQIASSCSSTCNVCNTAEDAVIGVPTQTLRSRTSSVIASSSFNPFPLDRLLGRPTPPWVPQTGFT